jgi:serine/threonine protein kinase
VKNKQFIDLITQMLLKNPLQRMTKYSQVKNHPYFCDFNFENLLTFNFIPPHIPKMENQASDAKPITFAHYMKNSLVEYKLPSGFAFDKKQIAEFNIWYKNF